MNLCTNQSEEFKGKLGLNRQKIQESVLALLKSGLRTKNLKPVQLL